MKVSTLLKKAKKLITKPEKWAKGSWAYDKEGHSVLASSKEAYAFCAVGALLRIDNASVSFVRDRAGALLVESIGSQSGESCLVRYADVSTYNDAPRRTHTQIMKLFDKAIAKAEQEERS